MTIEGIVESAIRERRALLFAYEGDERPERGAQQRQQPAERHADLGLQPAGAQHGHPLGAPDRVLQQRGLADPRLAPEYLHRGAPHSDAGQPLIDHFTLAVAAQKH